MSSEIALKVEGLSKCYQLYDRPRDRLAQFVMPRLRRLAGLSPAAYYREFWALRDVSFEVPKGQALGIIGRNGSGKSTLLQMIAGTLAPTAGSVRVHGRVAALLELGSGFNPEFSGRENVYLNAAVLGLSREETEARIEEILEFAGIGDFVDQPVKLYSSGMIVRLAFAVSVCVDPDVLIVDEALAVGDAGFQFKCLERLKRLTENGTTLLFVSHDIGMVKSFCGEAVYLEQGVVKASGPSEDVAELFAMDMRDEQRRSHGLAGGVVPKPFVGARRGIAFGSDDGQIVSAEFKGTGLSFCACSQGDDVSVEVTAKWRATVSRPTLSAIIQDRRMVEIGGAFFPLQANATSDGWREARLTVSWPAALAAGRYHVTLRLEDRASVDDFFLIEKQVGALAFDVVARNQRFLGAVDLNVRASSV